MARASAVYTLIVTMVAAGATAATAQCNNLPEVMQCNVPYWCQLRVGGFPISNTNTNDCICYQLCLDAQGQGEGSTCNYGDSPDGGRWYSITFNKYNGDNNYRGTVFCDPRQGGGGGGVRGLLADSHTGSLGLLGESAAAPTVARKLMKTKEQASLYRQTPQRVLDKLQGSTLN